MYIACRNRNITSYTFRRDMLTRRSQVSTHDPTNEYLNNRFLNRNRNIIPEKVSFETNKTNYSLKNLYDNFFFRSTSYIIYDHCALYVIGLIILVLEFKNLKYDYAYMFHLQRIFIV